jgi:hypothetical protein
MPPIPPNGKKTVQKPIPSPYFRQLRAFAFDPSCNRDYGNYMIIQVPFERPLKPGPVGRYVAVVDYDAANKCYYEPVDLDDPKVLANQGLDLSESDPRFHQQMVYAVVSETVERFKFALGRDIHWKAHWGAKDSPLYDKLLLFPHGVQEANAYYDPDLHGIVFGYFSASDSDPGNNLPGQTIFTCLAHDIIAHETTHAIVDGIRPYYMEPTNPDVAAFHEAFADLVALFQHFTMKDAVLEALRRTEGSLLLPKLSPQMKPGSGNLLFSSQLTKDNPIVGLANQFGDGIGLHGPLRSAIGTPPDPKTLETMTEPHERGSILVAAIFDAFFSVFLRRTEDLWRIAGLSRDDAKNVDLHPDLLARLANDAARVAGHFATFCIRGLDYAPAVDITFGDFLRALITADHDLVHDDDLNYRGAIVDAFRWRGIRPEGVFSYSEESLLWCPPEQPLTLPGLQPVPPITDEDERRDIQKANAEKLYAFAQTNGKIFGFDNVKNISVNSFHYVNRVGPDGNILSEMVAQVIEKGAKNDDPNDPKVFGGVSIIFNMDGSVRYCIRKSLKIRRAAQAAFRQSLWDSESAGYLDFQNQHVDFRALHRGF